MIENELHWEQALDRLDRLARFVYFAIAIVAGIAMWAAKITYDNDAQWAAIRANQAELQKRGDWMATMSERTARIEEQLKALREMTEVNNDLLKRLDERGK